MAVSWQDKPRSQSRVQPVQWSGVQVLLEQAESDILILLDCCAAGTANAGGGNGVTELIAACAFNATANGVGPHSFTNALVIELTELSRKPSYSIGELYSNIFIRTQCRIPEHGRERHPAPVHLVLTQPIGFSRSIQLSARHSLQVVNEQLPALSISTASESSLREDYSAVYPKRVRGSNTSHLNGIEIAPSVPQQARSMAPDQQITSFDDRVPRLLFAVRIKETFQPSELSTDLFSEWLRIIPLLVEEVKVEAGFDSFSSILIVSLPISLSSYIPTNPAVMCLGPIRSRNMILQSLDGIFSQKDSTSKNGEKSRTNLNFANTRRKRLWVKVRPSSSGRSPSRATTKASLKTSTRLSSKTSSKASPKSSPSPPSLLGTKAQLIPTAAAKSAVANVAPIKRSLGLNPYPKTFIPAWMVSKTDLVPADNTPITVFHQRDDSTQEPIFPDILRTKTATSFHLDEPFLTSKPQRQPVQNANANSNESINGIGQYNPCYTDIESMGLRDHESFDHPRISRKKPFWTALRGILAHVSIISVSRFTKTDQFAEVGSQSYELIWPGKRNRSCQQGECRFKSGIDIC